MCPINNNNTLEPGSFPATGFSELKRVSYFALSAGVTVQLKVLARGRLPVGEVKENDPSEVVEVIAIGTIGTAGAGGCSP